jgi:alkylation response protein AidB-like acyl-CoA dehydrogenase
MATTTAEAALVSERLDELLSAHDPKGDRTEFFGAQFDLGVGWVHFPEGLGGLGLSPHHQITINRRLDAAGAPHPATYNIIGYGMGAPTVLAHGTDEQRARWLRPMFTGEEVWCQLFSEPGAGSDVAGLATRAVRDGEQWVVNGQKSWTTMAHVSKWGMLVARHDPDLPKHAGMTYFIVDMEADGVDVRPLRQATGEAEFNEVYFTDTVIPDTDRLGDVGEGWRVSLTTLMNERVAIGGNVFPRGAGPIGEAVDLWRASPGDGAAREKLMRLWTEAEAARLTNWRAAQLREKGTPGPEGSVAKLVYAELNKRIYEYCMDLMGPAGMLYDSYDLVLPEDVSEERDIRKRFVRARANSIEGGTSEIMKNIVGERVLGLPGEPRVDKDLPWRDVPRS